MINLLPADHRRQLRAARANTLLVRYVVITIILIMLLLAMVAAMYQLLQSQKSAAEAHIAENQAKTTAYQEVRTQADALNTSLSTARTALDGSLSYSLALTRLAKILPDNTSLTSINLTSASFGAPIKLSFPVATESQALAIRDAFIASPYVAPGSVSFGTLSTAADGNSGYVLEINVTLKKEIAQ